MEPKPLVTLNTLCGKVTIVLLTEGWCRFLFCAVLHPHKKMCRQCNLTKHSSYRRSSVIHRRHTLLWCTTNRERLKDAGNWVLQKNGVRLWYFHSLILLWSNKQRESHSVESLRLLEYSFLPLEGLPSIVTKSYVLCCCEVYWLLPRMLS